MSVRACSAQLRVPQAHDARPVEGPEDAQDAATRQLLPARLRPRRALALLGRARDRRRRRRGRQPGRVGRRQCRRRRQRALRQCQALLIHTGPGKGFCVRVDERGRAVDD